MGNEPTQHAEDAGTQSDPLTGRIIGAAIEVHRSLGPGLLEAAYEECLAWELQQAGIAFRRQVALPVHYKGVRLDAGYRLDLLIEDRLIVELKSVNAILPVHEAQLLTYVKLSGVKTGLIINFHTALLRNGIIRRVL